MPNLLARRRAVAGATTAAARGGRASRARLRGARAPRRVEHAAVADAALRAARSHGAAARRSARSCSTCRSRSRRAGARYDDAAQRAAVRAVRRRRTAGARRCARCCGRARRWSSRPFTGATRRRAARAVHATTSRWPPSKYLARARATARCRSSSCSAARVFYARRGRRCCRPRGSRGSSEAEYRLPVRGVARDDGPPLPRHAPGCGSREDASTGSCAYKSRNALPSWERRVDALLPTRRSG